MTKKILQKSINANKVIGVQLQQISLPTFREKLISGQPYVRYGDNNLFPEFLQSLANRSALHNAILVSKLNYSYAKGLDYEGEGKDIITEGFIAHPNPYEDLNSIYKKCLYDYILYGAFAVNVIWDVDKEHIAEIYHCDVAKLRCGEKDERGHINEYYYSNNWLKTYTKDYKSIKAYNPKDRKGGQILYVREYRPGIDYYALPSYCGALNSIATDCEVSNYHLSDILNGMAPSKMITFSDGVPSEEEERAIKRQIEALYTGSDNAGKFILNFVNSPDNAPKVETLGGDNIGDQFTQLESSVLNQILAGHGVTSPLLVGLRVEGSGLGSNTDEIITAFSVFNNTIIKPIQDEVITEFNKLLKFTKGYENLELKPTTATPVEFTFSEGILSQILTQNELREMIGKQPIEEQIKEENNE